MTSAALCLVVLAGFIHASWNIVAKKAGGDARFALFTALVMMVVWAPLGLWLGWQEVPAWDTTAWGFVVISGLIHVVYYIVLLRGYRAADLTVVYPLARGTGPLLSSLFAIVILQEHVSALGATGIFAVITGIFLIAGGPALFRRSADGITHNRMRAGMTYGFFTGLCIASYTVVDGYAVKILLLSPILLDYVGNLVRIVLLLPIGLRDWTTTQKLWRRQWRYAAVVGVISPISYVLVLYAMRSAPLSHVAPAREISMLFAALLGGHFLGEGQRAARLFGAACMALGVIALALG